MAWHGMAWHQHVAIVVLPQVVGFTTVIETLTYFKTAVCAATVLTSMSGGQEDFLDECDLGKSAVWDG